MTNYLNKCMDLSQNDAATLIFDQQTYRLCKGFHLIGRKCKNFIIDDQSVDEKHAIISILSSGHQLIDLESENGTYVDNEKIDQSYILTCKVSTIRFGNLNATYTILNHSDSGFLDSKINSPDKDNSEIVASSPKQIRFGNSTRFRNTRVEQRSLTNSSTPNCKQIFSSSISSSKSVTNKNNNNNCGKEKETHLNSTHFNDNDSFFVPETQQLEQSRDSKIKSSNIFDTIDESIKKYINDNDCIPETQEIFLRPATCGSNDMVYIDTQEFNALSDTNTDSNDGKSQNLCRHAEIFGNDTSILISNNITNKSKLTKDEKLKETEELFELQWNETKYEIRSNVTTPDLDLENRNIEVNEEKIGNDALFNREESVTPDLIHCNDNINLIENIKIQENLADFTKSNKDQIFNDFMDNDDLLIPTQPFILPAKSHSTKLPTKSKIVLNAKDLNLFEENEIPEREIVNDKNLNQLDCVAKENVCSANFPVIKLEINLDKTEKFLTPFLSLQNKNVEKNCNENAEKLNNNDQDDEEIACTQLFIPPKRNNSVSSFKSIKSDSMVKHISSIADLDCTQEFIHPNSLISGLARKIHKSRNASLQKDNMEPTQKILLNEVATTRKRSNIVLMEKGGRIIEPVINKKPSPNETIKSVLKTKSKSSTVSQDGNSNTPTKSVSAISVNSVDADFMLDICTPSIDVIKLPVQEQGYLNVIKKVKKPENRIFIEETDDEDDEIDELENMYNKNESNSSKKSTISSNLNSKSSKSIRSFNKNMEKLKPISKEKTYNSHLRPKSKSLITSEEDQIIESHAKLRFRNNNKYASEKIQSKNESKPLKVIENEKNSKTKLTLPQNQRKRKSSEKSNSNNESTETQNEVSLDSKSTTYKAIRLEDEIQIERRSSRNKTNSKSITSSHSNSSELENLLLEKKQNLPSRSSRNKQKNNKTLTFTKVDESKYAETIKNIGYEIVKEPEEASIIITNNEISRTLKLLIGLAKGIPIISVDWLDKIEEKNFSYVPYDFFYVNDKKTEKRFNFSLKKTLNLAATASTTTQSIFNNYNFMVTQNTNPPKVEIERIILCAGGKILDSEENFADDIYIVSDKKDSKLWQKFKKNFKNLKIIKTEGILLSVMQHRNRLDDHVFK